MKTTNLNELNNTTIENNEILSYDEFCDMSLNDVLRRSERNLMTTRLLMIENKLNMINFKIETNRINRGLDKISQQLATI